MHEKIHEKTFDEEAPKKEKMVDLETAMRKSKEARFQANSAHKIAEEAQLQLEDLESKEKNMYSKVMDLSAKAKALTETALKAEKAVEDDPRSKTRSIKTAKNIK